MGLILGAALAGGAEGAGKAAETSVASMQDAQQKLDLVKMQEQLEEQKDLRVQEAAHGFRMQEQGAQFAHEDVVQANQQKFLGSEGAANRANALALGQLQSNTEIKAAGIHAGAEIAATQISAAASQANARLMASAKNIQTLADGRIVAIGIDPTTMKQTVNPLMDPNDPNKPLMGMKNLDQRTILLAQGLMQSSVHKMQMGDQAGAAADQQAAQTVLTTGQLPPTMGKTPSPQSIDYLVKNPSTAAQFDAQFGAGQASKVLSAAATQQSGTPATAQGATPGTPAYGSPSGYPAAAAPAAPTAPVAPAGSTLISTPAPGQLGSGLALPNDPAGLVASNMNY